MRCVGLACPCLTPFSLLGTEMCMLDMTDCFNNTEFVSPGESCSVRRRSLHVPSFGRFQRAAVSARRQDGRCEALRFSGVGDGGVVSWGHVADDLCLDMRQTPHRFRGQCADNVLLINRCVRLTLASYRWHEAPISLPPLVSTPC